MPRMRRSVRVSGAGGVSIAMVVSGRLGSASGPGVRATVWADRGDSEGRIPYRAGGPARARHLADSSVGCRGFNGPLPLPLLIRALRLSANATGPRRVLSTPPPAPTPPRLHFDTVPQRGSTRPLTTAEADACEPL